MVNEGIPPRAWEYIADATSLAQRVLETGELAARLSPMPLGGTCALAFQKVDEETAAVFVFIRSSDSDYLGLTVVLRSTDGSLWRATESIVGTRWRGESLARPDRSWQGFGPVRLAVSGYAPAGDGYNHERAGRVPIPHVGWKCVTGLASRRISAIRASSTMERRENGVHPHTGAFLVLLRAPWTEDLFVEAIDINGNVISVGAPTPS